MWSTIVLEASSNVFYRSLFDVSTFTIQLSIIHFSLFIIHYSLIIIFCGAMRFYQHLDRVVFRAQVLPCALFDLFATKNKYYFLSLRAQLLFCALFGIPSFVGLDRAIYSPAILGFDQRGCVQPPGIFAGIQSVHFHFDRIFGSFDDSGRFGAHFVSESRPGKFKEVQFALIVNEAVFAVVIGAGLAARAAAELSAVVF